MQEAAITTVEYLCRVDTGDAPRPIEQPAGEQARVVVL